MEEAIVALLTSNGAPNMPLSGRLTRMTGPLPLTFGAPAAGREPFILDVAMGVLARGKILFTLPRRGRKRFLSPGTGVDADGKPTTDAGRIIDGG